jgi:hypothetical protein
LAAVAFIRAQRRGDLEAQAALVTDVDDARALCVTLALLAWSAIQLLTIKLGITPDEFIGEYHAGIVNRLASDDT